MDILDKSKILEVKLIELKGIPCFYVKPHSNYYNGATIVYYHGWSSNKNNNLFLGKLLAFHGYGVILPDAIYHGDRNAIANYNVDALRKYFWEVIFNSLEEYKGLISEGESLYEINKDRVAVMGSSMGGFIASGIFADNVEIKCLVNMNGACAWGEAEKIFRDIDKSGKGAATLYQREKIKTYDPLGKREELYPRPILMLHGDADTSVSIDIQRHFYKEMKEVYRDEREKLVLNEIPRLNHYKTVNMMESSIEWLEKYL